MIKDPQDPMTKRLIKILDQQDLTAKSLNQHPGYQGFHDRNLREMREIS